MFLQEYDLKSEPKSERYQQYDDQDYASLMLGLVSDPASCFQMYYHGEVINVHVSITNNSNKNIKNIIVSGKYDRSCFHCERRDVH